MHRKITHIHANQNEEVLIIVIIFVTRTGYIAHINN